MKLVSGNLHENNGRDNLIHLMENKQNPMSPELAKLNSISIGIITKCDNFIQRIALRQNILKEKIAETVNFTQRHTLFMNAALMREGFNQTIHMYEIITSILKTLLTLSKINILNWSVIKPEDLMKILAN